MTKPHNSDPRSRHVLLGLDHRLARIEEVAVVTSFAVMLLTIGGVIAARYVPGLGLGKYADLGVGLIPWVGMLGAALALREGRHIGVEALRQRLPKAVHDATLFIANIGVLLFLALLLWSGWDLVLRQMASGTTTPAMELPRWLISLSLPVGAACATIHQVVGLLAGKEHRQRSLAKSQPHVSPPPQSV